MRYTHSWCLCCSEEATQLKGEVDKVKTMLNESKHAQSAADESLKAVNSDIDYTQQQIAMVSVHL